MPVVFTTVAAASSTRIIPDNGPPRKKQVPQTKEQLKQKRDDRKVRQEKIDAAVEEWRAYTFAKAEELATVFDLKPHYFLVVFFQGGAHLIHHQEKVNPYNAFKSEKAAEARECESSSRKVPELHQEHITEYLLLTDEQKDELVERFTNTRTRNFNLHRDTPRGKIQDVANIVRNMKMLMAALGTRVGIEGFFCIVCNNTEFHMVPECYFTSPELEDYMQIATQKRWDTGEVGMKVEVFAIAGCDASSTCSCTCLSLADVWADLLRNSKQKSDWMKAEIRMRMGQSLGACVRCHSRLACTDGNVS
ncbi:hypothetical protein B0H10DRAFT_1787022 [Mycena sp. CBHHK59/15]|nr:hypothetical protein B0H10DRAFT_1787022 [Mycena sp. CBHHK59/15]